MSKKMFETKLVEIFKNDERFVVCTINKNGMQKKAIVLKNSTVSPAVCLEEILETVNTERCFVEEVANEIVHILLNAPIPQGIRLPSIEKIFKTATLRFVGDNQSERDDILCEAYGLPVVLNGFVDGDGVKGAYIIHKHAIETYLNMGHTKAEIIENAIKTIENSTILSFCDELTPTFGLRDYLNPDDCRYYPMYVLTNTRMSYGATSMFTSYIPRLANNLKRNIFIIPSSVHEILLVPDDGAVNIKELKALIKDVNSSMVSNKDFLSNNLYCYSREKKMIEMVA